MVIKNQTVDNIIIGGKFVLQIRTKIDGVMTTVYDKPVHEEIPYCDTGGVAWANAGIYISPNIHSISTKSYINDFNIASTLNTYLYFGVRNSYSPMQTKANIMIRQVSGTETFQFRRDWGISTSYGAYDTERTPIKTEFNIELNPEYTEINGIRKATPEGNFPVSVNPLFIGAMSGDSSTPINGQYKANSQRVYPYQVKEWATGKLILDVIVVRYISGGVRLYDKVRQDYLPSIGTGDFIDPFETSHPFVPPRVIPKEVYALGTPLKALRNVSSAYIDTGHIPVVGKDKFEIKTKTYETERSHMCAGWGDASQVGAYEWWYYYAGADTLSFYLNSNQDDFRNDILLEKPISHKWRIMTRDKFGLYLDGSLKGTVLSIKNYETDLTMNLFSRSRGISYFEGDMQYAYNINEFGEYDYDMIAFEHNDGRVGMLDIPTLTLFENQSTNPSSKFIPIYDGVPDWVHSYGTPVLALKSVNGAYIDTQLKQTNETSLKFKVKFSGVYGRAGGVEEEIVDLGNRRLGIYTYNTEDRIRIYSYSSYSDRATSVYKDDSIEIMTGYYGRFFSDDIIYPIEDIRNTSFTGANNIYCYGATNLDGSPNYAEGLVTYEFIVMDKLDEVFNGIPLIHNDGRVGVFDIRTRTFFENANTNADSEFVPITDYSIATALSNMGVHPSSDTAENINTLMNMGVRL